MLLMQMHAGQSKDSISRETNLKYCCYSCHKHFYHRSHPLGFTTRHCNFAPPWKGPWSPVIRTFFNNVQSQPVVYLDQPQSVLNMAATTKKVMWLKPMYCSWYIIIRIICPWDTSELIKSWTYEWRVVESVSNITQWNRATLHVGVLFRPPWWITYVYKWHHIVLGLQ